MAKNRWPVLLRRQQFDPTRRCAVHSRHGMVTTQRADRHCTKIVFFFLTVMDYSYSIVLQFFPHESPSSQECGSPKGSVEHDGIVAHMCCFFLWRHELCMHPWNRMPNEIHFEAKLTLIYVHIYAFIYTFTIVCVCVCVCTCMYTCSLVTYMHIYVAHACKTIYLVRYMHTYTDAHKHTYIQAHQYRNSSLTLVTRRWHALSQQSWIHTQTQT